MPLSRVHAHQRRVGTGLGNPQSYKEPSSLTSPLDIVKTPGVTPDASPQWKVQELQFAATFASGALGERSMSERVHI
jgi:hypothetical protein